MEDLNTLYIFIIDTNLYPGGFERELCAYVTGVIGECGVGKEEQDKALLELDPEYVKFFERNVPSLPNTFDGIFRPCTIWKTNKAKYTSVAIFFEKNPELELFNIMKKRAYKFAEQYNDKIKISGFRLIVKDTTYYEYDIQDKGIKFINHYQ